MLEGIRQILREEIPGISYHQVESITKRITTFIVLKVQDELDYKEEM